jgi:hypothetical protein
MPVALALFAALAAASAPPPRLSVPIACAIGRDCEIQNYVDRDPGPGSRDYRCGSRTYDGHSGLDIRLLDMMAQKAGVAVLAAADGKVLRVRDGIVDRSVRELGAASVKGQECGNGLVIGHSGGLSTQYCHMAQGSLTVKPGDLVKTGTRLGLVGLSGNTEYPHLHMTVRQGDTVIDPFAPEAGAGAGVCGAGDGLWRPEARSALAYKAGVVLNVGFAQGPVDMAAIEAGRISAPTAGSSALVAYVRAIGLQAGDRQSLTLTGPKGAVLAESNGEPLARDQAQRLLYVGKPRPPTGWSPGHYGAAYRIVRAGKVVLERRWDLKLQP